MEPIDGHRPRVSVIVPCRNERAHIETCLEGVLAFDEPEGGFEVIVADGLSTDGTREVLRDFAGRDPRLRIIDNEGRTAPSGLNAAIAAAAGEVILRIDAHTRYAADYLVKCLDVLQESGADNVGGPARTEAVGLGQRAIAAAYHSRFSVGGARFHDIEYSGPVDTVTYGCWPRGTFEKYGLFDEELVRNQDDEHNLRINRGGGLVWQDSSIRSWYSPRPSLKSLFRQYRQYGFWKVRVIQKHGIPASPRHLVPAAFLLVLAVLGLVGLVWHSAWWAAITLVGLYLAADISVSCIVAAGEDWDLLPLLPLVFPCYHFGYGIGFAEGILNFVILRRGAPTAWKELTRSS